MITLKDSIVPISDAEFQNISVLVKSRFGINLTDKKKALVSGRLNKILKVHGFSNFKEYFDSVVNDASGKQLIQLIDRISTNHTYFYRENEHFRLLDSLVLPSLFRKFPSLSPDDFKIWCAGCASGEEAYTTAMVLNDYIGEGHIWPRSVILGTDISVSALSAAMSGIYPKERLSVLPEGFKRRYMEKTDPDHYEVTPHVKKMITFRQLNLMDNHYPFQNKFHMIFCRNVMIYFSQETKEELLEKLCRNLHPGGYLFIGHSETLGRNHSLFEYVRPALYCKK